MHPLGGCGAAAQWPPLPFSPLCFTYKYRRGERKSGTHKKERVDRSKERRKKKTRRGRKKRKRKKRKTEEELPPTPPLLEPLPPLAITDN